MLGHLPHLGGWQGQHSGSRNSHCPSLSMHLGRPVPPAVGDIPLIPGLVSHFALTGWESTAAWRRGCTRLCAQATLSNASLTTLLFQPRRASSNKASTSHLGTDGVPAHSSWCSGKRKARARGGYRPQMQATRLGRWRSQHWRGKMGTKPQGG